MAAHCRRLGIEAGPGEGWGKLLLAVFERTVEDRLVQPTFITGYPTEVSPLARANDADPGITDRFELLGRVGWASIDAQGSVGDFTAGGEDDGVGVGVGAQYFITQDFAVRGDYTRLTSNSDDGGDDGVDAYGVSGICRNGWR